MDTRDAGRMGGKAGTGAAKRRGDSAYYKALRAKVKTYAATFNGKPCPRHDPRRLVDARETIAET